jgi:hypothetical protein
MDLIITFKISFSCNLFTKFESIQTHLYIEWLFLTMLKVHVYEYKIVHNVLQYLNKGVYFLKTYYNYI